MQTPDNILLTFMLFGPPVLSAHGLPKRVFLASIQPFAQEFIDAIPYPESAAQWLISLLDLLAGIANRHDNFDHIVITETEYKQLSAILDDFVYGVGEDENHPLSAVMTLIGVLIKTYEDRNFPKLVDLFPELTKETQVELVSEGSNPSAATFESAEANLAVAFFSIGYLLSEAGATEKSVSAYNLALRLKPDYADAYYNRGIAKVALGNSEKAKADFQTALELAEQQDKEDLKTDITYRLQRLSHIE